MTAALQFFAAFISAWLVLSVLIALTLGRISTSSDELTLTDDDRLKFDDDEYLSRLAARALERSPRPFHSLSDANSRSPKASGFYSNSGHEGAE